MPKPYKKDYDMRGSFKGGPAAARALSEVTGYGKRKKKKGEEEDDLEYEEKDEDYRKLMKRIRRR